MKLKLYSLHKLTLGILLLSLVNIMMSGCGDKTVEQTLCEADTLISTNPEAAFSKLNNIKGQQMSASQLAHYSLLMAKSAYKSYHPLPADSIIETSVTYYRERGDSLEYQSLFYYGMTLNWQGIKGRALIPLTEAYNLAESAGDWYYAALSARELASVYAYINIVGSELEWAVKEKKNYAKTGKRPHMAWADLDVMSALIWNGRWEEAMKVGASLDSVEYSENEHFRHKAMGLWANAYNYKGESEKVVETYNDLIDDGGKMSTVQWTILADNYLTLGNKRLAKSVCDSAMNVAGDRIDSLQVYRIKMKLFESDSDYESAYYYAKEFGYGIMADGDEAIMKPQIQPFADYMEDKAKEEFDRRQQVEKINLLFIICLVMACAAIIFILLYIRANIKLKNKEMTEMLLRSRALENDLKAEHKRAESIQHNNNLVMQHAMELEDKLLKERQLVEGMGGELSSHINENALINDALEESRQLTDELKHSLRLLMSTQMNILNEMCDKWYHSADETTHKNKFRKDVENVLKKLRSSDMLSKIEDLINRHDNNWMRNLRLVFPDMRDEQYELAMYLYIGYSFETIAMLMERKTLQSVYLIKHKLKKMLEMNPSDEALQIRKRLGLTNVKKTNQTHNIKQTVTN